MELKDELKNKIEIPKEDDNQLQAAVSVLTDGEEATREKLKQETPVDK